MTVACPTNLPPTLAKQKNLEDKEENVCFKDIWINHTDRHADIFDKTRLALSNDVAHWVDLAVNVIRSGGKIMFCGNGGSAADAQHIAAELSVKLCRDRPPISALCLSLDPSAMTACANDYGYEYVFARQVMAIGRPGDMLVGLSTSGNSNNVIEALAQANHQNITTVTLTGEQGGRALEASSLCIRVPCPDSTAFIQEMHIMIGHIFCSALEHRLGLI